MSILSSETWKEEGLKNTNILVYFGLVLLNHSLVLVWFSFSVTGSITIQLSSLKITEKNFEFFLIHKSHTMMSHLLLSHILYKVWPSFAYKCHKHAPQCIQIPIYHLILKMCLLNSYLLFVLPKTTIFCSLLFLLQSCFCHDTMISSLC